MANNQIVTTYDDAGVPDTAVKTYAVSVAGSFVVKGAPGRLVKASVTTSAAGTITVYDNATGASSGTVLLAIPTTPGNVVYDVNLPAANGITVVAAATPSAVTLGYA